MNCKACDMIEVHTNTYSKRLGRAGPQRMSWMHEEHCLTLSQNMALAIKEIHAMLTLLDTEDGSD